MESWKICFDQLGRTIVTSGELGIVKFFDVETKENIGTLKTVDVFATSIAYV